MTIAERHKIILEKLHREGFVKVGDVAEELDVTMVTIRRDLKVMEEKGLLYRSHGGATPANPQIGDRHVVEKSQLKMEEKVKIAKAAIKLIEESDSIIINSGSTIYTFAEHITPKGDLTVVSASLSASILLGNMPGVNVVQLGGNFRGRSVSVSGSYAINYFNNIACSKLFLGIDGIDEEVGVTTSNVEEAELNRAMMNNVLKTIVLCDSSKFSKQGFGRICSLDRVDIVITDSGVSSRTVEMLERHGVKLIIAE